MRLERSWLVLLPFAAMAACGPGETTTHPDVVTDTVRTDVRTDTPTTMDVPSTNDVVVQNDVPVDSRPADDAPPGDAGAHCTTAATCDDSNACTTDTCDPGTMFCAHLNVAGCCLADADCNDGNACTTDSCNTATHTCTTTAVAGCCTTAADCTSADPCMSATCSATNTCGTAPITGCCASGATQACYMGAAGTMGVGICHGGTQTCGADHTFSGACAGQVLPAAAEVCGNLMDDNCNGTVDEGCATCPPAPIACYTGPAGTVNVGACHAGTQTCNVVGTVPVFGACTGQVTPVAEACNATGGPNGVDENCNGMVDEGCFTVPTNDVRTSATLLTFTAHEVTISATTNGATHDGPTVPCSCTTSGNVWYRFVLTGQEVVYFDTQGSSATLDTSLFITDSAGTAIPAQTTEGQGNLGVCNDDNGTCSGTNGFATHDSRTWADLAAGTYYLAVGGCGQGNFTLHAQHIPHAVGSFFYSTRISGNTTTTTGLVGTSVSTPACTVGPSGEDVRWMTSCGSNHVLFSLCASDCVGTTCGTWTRSAAGRNFDPVMYITSAQTGASVDCNDDGGNEGGTNCVGTGGDSSAYGSRLNNVAIPRGIAASFVDERSQTSGLQYRLVYNVPAN